MSNNPFMDQADPRSATAAAQPTADFAPIVDRIAQLEGTAQNRRSTARGVGQFTDGALLTTYRRHNPQSGLSDQQILALKDDPDAMRTMLTHLVGDNAAALSAGGFDATPGNIYLANHFGSDGARSILSADPKTPLVNIVGQKVIAANPNLAGMTAGDAIAMTNGKMQDAGTAPSQPSTSDPAPNPFMDAASGAPSDNTINPSVQPAPAPSAAPPETLSGWLGNTGSELASLDPVSNALVNGQGHRLQMYGHGVQDATAGIAHGVATPFETLMKAAGGVTRFVGDTKSADTLDQWADGLDQATANLAHDPNSTLFSTRVPVGEITSTLPLAYLEPMSAAPGVARAMATREAMAAAGETAPFATRMAAALGRYGNMAAQGAAGGALLSKGEDVAGNTMRGAVLAPAVGAAVEKVIAPIAAKASTQAQRIADAVSKRLAGEGGEDLPAVDQTVRKATDLPNSTDFIPAGKAPPGVAQFADDGSPFLYMDRGAPTYGQPNQPGARGYSEQAAPQPASASQGTPPKSAASVPARPINPDALQAALGSRGARTGIEATADLPRPVQQHVEELLAQDVPLDQALREADITYAGGSPTAADVTRNPAAMTAVKEGAKAGTVEGQALNLQQAQNNAALHATAKAMVGDYGGPTAPGEAMQASAKSLLDASQAERANVSDLYRAADSEAAVAKNGADRQIASAQDRADLEASVAEQVKARAKLDTAQEAYKSARNTSGADVDKARTALEKARTDYRAVSDSPSKSAPVDTQAGPGYIDLSPVRTALNTPEMSNPTIEGAKTLRSGVLGLMDAYGSKNDLYSAEQAERIRQAIGDAFDPQGGSINSQVGKLKAKVDDAMDAVDAGTAYKQARAAHKAWADKYENPEGVAKLIRTDASGNLVHDDAWRSVENLVGAKNDRPFLQIVERLKGNGDTASVNKLKALIVQDAYEHATGRAAGTAADQLGNSVFSGSQFHARLNTIGLNKLRAIFSSQEVAKLASLGRAGIAINEAVPGTVNTSHTAMAISNALRTLNKKEAGTLGKALDTTLHVSAPIVGAALHGGAEGAGAGVAVDTIRSGVQAAIGAARQRSAAAKLAEGLKALSNPANARAFDQRRATRIAEALAGRKANQGYGRAAAIVSAGSDNSYRHR